MVVIGFVVMILLLFAQLFFAGDHDIAYRRCPSCGLSSVRVGRVWEPSHDQPSCSSCGARFRLRDGGLIPV